MSDGIGHLSRFFGGNSTTTYHLTLIFFEGDIRNKERRTTTHQVEMHPKKLGVREKKGME
jgi:hypothetical protein